jgi:hypothetical protein
MPATQRGQAYRLGLTAGDCATRSEISSRARPGASRRERVRNGAPATEHPQKHLQSRGSQRARRGRQ